MSITLTAAIPDFLYGTAWKEDRTATLAELAIRAGFRGIDTANQRRHYFEAGVGQLPYDPDASLPLQVAQSLACSLEHLGTDYVDSYVLHGPSSRYEWADTDAEVWEAMTKGRDAGHRVCWA